MSSTRLRRAAARATPLFLGLALATGPAAADGRIVISQVYGGGGNSGATYTNDFIELFNAGDAPVTLDGWSVQYASATGTSWSATALRGSLQPGQYYLVQQAKGAGGTTALPTPDASGAIAMSGSDGKVAVVASTTALSGACPLAGAIDLVGFGSANCFTGTAAAARLSNTTAAIRGEGGCLVAGNNASDFRALAPTPRNTASTPNACQTSGPALPQLSIADLRLDEGDSGSTLFGFTVSLSAPASSPVSFDISTADGSATAADADYRARSVQGARIEAGATSYRFEVEVLGDTRFESDEAFLVRIGNLSGAELQRGEASGRIDNDDAQPLPLLPISAIQGAGIGDSPWLGQRVAVEGIITALRSNGYFVQTAAGEDDGDATTAEGLFVFTSSAPPSAAQPGVRARVEGQVSQFLFSPHGYPVTQLNWAQLYVQAENQPLPAAVELGAADLNPAAAINRLGRYQGMRISLPPVVSVSGSNNFGDFFVTLPEVARPFREPGIALLDAIPLPGGLTPPRFDMNPERMRVASNGLLGGSVLHVDSQSRIEGLEGVLYYDRGEFSLLQQPGSAASVSGGIAARPAPAAAFDAIAIGSYNIENFNAATASPARLGKLTQVFCHYLQTPDIVGLVEIANLASAQRLAQAINDNEFGHCPQNPQYVAYLLSNSGSQRLGFLVSTRDVLPGVPRVAVNDVVEEGLADALIAPDGSNSGPLFDRPPLRLTATVNQDNGRSVQLSVIANHLLSLLNVLDMAPRSDSWGNGGARSRGKRLQQAIRLAEIVDARQQADAQEKIVLLGDFNAFEFNDGYVDVMGIIGGNPAAANDVLAFGASPLQRPLANLADTVAASDRYSYVFAGSAQALDHVLVNQPVLEAATAQLHYVRVNTDFGYDNAQDDSVPVRTSDHDPLVAHLRLPEFAWADVDLTLSIDGPRLPLVNGASGDFQLTLGNVGQHGARDSELVVGLSTAAELVQIVDSAGWNCRVRAVAALQAELVCTLPGRFAAGASERLLVRAAMPRSAPQSFLSVSGQLGSSGDERNSADNAAAFSVRVVGRPGG